MATSTGMTRLESFPFTSHDDGYDADGYPVYDRAVGSGMLRDTFAKFFTNGIFPNPGTALQIGKASSGLAVTIQPGIGIIKGAMGGIRGDQPITVTLDTQAPQGNTAYGIMLRFDNTDGFADSRSLLINVVRGDASSSPTPPTPDTTTPEVYELRLGYVVVPSGATDLSNATVTNEKGLAVCPYAAPFEEIDVSGIVADFKVSADEALSSLLAYYKANKDAIDAALDGSAATYLQQQISALQEQMENFDLSGSVDNETIEYSTAAGEVEPKLRVKDGGIGDDQITSGKSLISLNGLDGQMPYINNGSISWGQFVFDLLWQGEASWISNSDSNNPITVTNLSKYDLFLVESKNSSGGYTFYEPLIAYRVEGWIIGFGFTLKVEDGVFSAAIHQNNELNTYGFFAAEASGDTIKRAAKYQSQYLSFVNGSAYNSSTSVNMVTMTKIWGIA